MSSEETAPESSAPHNSVSAETREVTIRRAPKYSAFMFVGAVIVVLAALFTTYAFPEVEGETTWNQVFGFLLLPAAAIGAALGGIVALILDRVIGRKEHQVQAQLLTTGEDDSEKSAEDATAEDAKLDSGTSESGETEASN